MNREEAVKLYLARTKPAETTIRKLMLWDKNLSFPENANRIGVPGSQVFYLARKFNLKYVKIGKGNYERKPITEKSKKIHR